MSVVKKGNQSLKIFLYGEIKISNKKITLKGTVTRKKSIKMFFLQTDKFIY